MPSQNERKLSKEEVNYRKSPGGGKRCGTCEMMRPMSCTLVAGHIQKNMVCNAWEPVK